MKLAKIEAEIVKTQEKIAALQGRLKELNEQKTEQENLQIIALVRSMRLSPTELKDFLDEIDKPAAPNAATGYTTTYQEDADDEK